MPHELIEMKPCELATSAKIMLIALRAENEAESERLERDIAEEKLRGLGHGGH